MAGLQIFANFSPTETVNDNSLADCHVLHYIIQEHRLTDTKGEAIFVRRNPIYPLKMRFSHESSPRPQLTCTIVQHLHYFPFTSFTLHTAFSPCCWISLNFLFNSQVSCSGEHCNIFWPISDPILFTQL